MDPRDFELIAMNHLLSRYRLTGQLPNINGQPFDLNEFKRHLSTGVADSDTDINVNIEKVENTVVDCDNENEQDKSIEVSNNNIVTADVTEDNSPIIEPALIQSNTAPEVTEVEKTGIGGRLFQFFNKDPGK